MTEPESSLDPQDWPEFRRLAHEMLDAALDHLESARERRVWTPPPDEVIAALAGPVPVEPQGAKAACHDLISQVLPYGTGNTHPRFFGWVHGSGTPGGVIADMMASAMNANLGGRNQGAVHVEQQVITWFREIFGFPGSASGLLVSGTSMATLIALCAARFAKAGPEVRKRGLRPERGRLVGYASAEAHSCLTRAFDILGLGSQALRPVPVDARHAMDTDALEAMISDDLAAGNLPFCVAATAGSVNTGAFDDLTAIADVCEKNNLWLHVDGAFGAACALSDRLRTLVSGIERADSLALDFHKWMHVQYDAGLVLIRDETTHRGAFTSRPEYLAEAEQGLAAGNPWFCEYGPELSRSFRALKIWFALKEHGVARIAAKIEDNCAQAEYLGRKVAAHPALELSAPVSLNIVCLRYRPPGLDSRALNDLNARIVIAVQESGIAAPSTTRMGGALAIRVNITNHRTRMSDMDVLLEAVLVQGARLAG